MREINLNGYIDDEVWFGDEITPDSLHETLYEPGTDQSEDVHIRLNSYGGSCNAAVRMHDDLVAYPGKISITRLETSLQFQRHGGFGGDGAGHGG